MKAIWKDTVIAQSDDTVVIEGNHYFPPESVVAAHVRPSATTSVCPWKGTAHYYDVVVGDDVNTGAAWYYPAATDKAKSIEGRVAFWRGIQVTP